MSESIYDRIRRRADELGLSDRAVSMRAGMGVTLVRDIGRSTKASPSTETIRKLARALNVTPDWLAFGVDLRGADDVEASHGVDDTSSAFEVPGVRFVRPVYGGVVEAGPFRPVEDFDDDPKIVLSIEEADPAFPDVRLISFDVAGDSMNDLRPTPILPGQRVIAFDFAGLRNRLALRDGMVVVVEQVRDGGHLRERSVKQLALHRDRTEFCPRSTNPKHKPIVVPYEMRVDEDDDGRQVRIIAIVRRIVTDLPAWT